MNEKINVRKFMPSDAESLLEIHDESAVNFEDIGINREYVILVSQRHDFRFLIAEIDGGVCGFIGALFYTNVGRGEIGPVCVSRGFRGRGVGGILLKNAINLLKGVGIKRLIARVKAKNGGGVDFFINNGFYREGYFRGYTCEGEDVIQLVRFI